MPPAANNNQQQYNNHHQQQPQSAIQPSPHHRFSKDGPPQHRSSSSRSINPATGMPERVGPYSIREEIGRGSFATVFRGEKVTVNPPTLVAIKAVVRSKLTTKLLENLESEIRLLKGIKQRNVVELLDCLKTEAHIYLVMAFCSAGDLSQYIRKRGQIPSLTSSMQQAFREKYPHPKDGGLNELVVRCFLGQLAEALKFLRKQDIIHRDIKPQNLLLHPPDASDISAGHPAGIPLLRVADFGFARALPNTSLAETLCGSPLYMAPEILRYEKYDAKADLWSVGAVTFEMTVGKPPFRAQNHVELLRRIERGEDRIKFPDDRSPTASTEAAAAAAAGREDPAGAPPTKVPDDVKALIRGLLKRNPVERMSFNDFFHQADGVARWGEASLIAPGTINDGKSSPQTQQDQIITSTGLPLRPSSNPDMLNRRQHSSRNASGRTSPANDKAENVLARQQAPPAPSPVIKDVQVTDMPIVPSSGEEQEMAFVRLPANASPAYLAPENNRTTDPQILPVNTQTPQQQQQSSADTPSRPSSVTRRSTFKPKYVVGIENNQASGAGNTAPLKTRDFAVITTTAATPTTSAHASSSNRSHSRGASQDNLLADTATTGAIAQNAPLLPPSNLTLAIPTPRDRQSASSSPSSAHQQQQRDMLASAMTGDDDSILGKEYVVVEKRNVEINALADEMASVPRRQASISRRSSRGILSRQTTGYGQSPATAAGFISHAGASNINSPSPPSPAQPYPPTAAQAISNEHPPFATPAAARLSPATYGSSPRSRSALAGTYGSPVRYGNPTSTPASVEPAYTSPLNIVGGIVLSGNTIGKALNVASLKLFGSPSENIWLRRHTHRLPFGRRRTRALLPQEEMPSAEEEELVQRLEDIAQKATVIFDFADSKLMLMQPHSSQHSSSSQRSLPQPDGTLPAAAQLALVTSQASPFFANAAVTSPQSGLAARRTSSSSDKHPGSPLAKTPQASPNPGSAAPAHDSTMSSKPDLLPGETLVLYLKALAFLSKGIEQAKDFWATRASGQTASADLNEYVQWLRARFNECFDKAEYAKGKLIGEIPDSAMLAEKLVFDRALEMSRAAAVSELMGDNSQECEIAYDTALWMLYTILDETMQEGEPVDEEDKVTVRNFIESIKGRLAALKRKMRSSSAI